MWKSLFADVEKRGKIIFPELAEIPVGIRRELISGSARKTMRSPSYWCVLLSLAIVMIVLSVLAIVAVRITVPGSLIVLIAFIIASVAAIIIPLRIDLRIRKKWIQKRLNELGFRPTCCLLCQYDLHGTPGESTACPECGAAIAAVVGENVE